MIIPSVYFGLDSIFIYFNLQFLIIVESNSASPKLLCVGFCVWSSTTYGEEEHSDIIGSYWLDIIISVWEHDRDSEGFEMEGELRFSSWANYCVWGWGIVHEARSVAPWLFCLGVSWICLYCAMNCNNRMHLGLLIGYQRIRLLSASLHYTVCLEILLFWRLSWLTPRWQRMDHFFIYYASTP